MDTRSHSDVLTVPEVAELLRVSTDTVRRWMRHNGLPHSQFCKGGVIRFDHDTVLEWWRGRQRKSPVESIADKIRSMRRSHARR